MATATRTIDQRLERTHGRGAASDLAVTIVSTVSIALPLLFYLHQHVEMLRHGYAIESLEQRRVEMTERQRQLRVERLERAGFARIEAAAASLGFGPPEPLDVYIAPPARPRAALGGAGPVMRAPSD